MTKPDRRLLLIPLCVFFFQYPCCFSNEVKIEPEERTTSMPGSFLLAIDQAIRNGNFSCDKKELFSRHFFELADGRLLILAGIPDYLCASNSFMPVTVDDRGQWLAGPILPGAPSWIVSGPDNALWLAAQWQVEGTFPALYRSTNGVDWKEIKLPENRDVDCCFERLERICFQQKVVHLEFTGATGGKTAYWETGLGGIAGSGPVWKRTARAADGDPQAPCPFDLLGPGSWSRKEADRSGGIVFKKNARQTKISVLIPGDLTRCLPL